MTDGTASPSPRELLADLEAAASAAAVLGAGRPVMGLRAVEPGPRRRGYLVALDGPSFLCLRADLSAETVGDRVREIAVAGLLCEHAGELVDAGALRELAATAALTARRPTGLPPPAAPALHGVATAAEALAVWRDDPLRELASLVAMESGTRLHNRLRGEYARFVSATEPLVEAQDRLPADLVAALRAVEQAAGAAAVGEALASRLGALVAVCDEQADEIISLHLTPLA